MGSNLEGGFVRAIAESDLKSRRVIVTMVGGRRIAIGAVKGMPFACLDACPHAGSSFAEGRIIGDQLVCPLHGARFDPSSGACVNGPYSPLVLYSARLVEGFIEIELNHPIEQVIDPLD